MTASELAGIMDGIAPVVREFAAREVAEKTAPLLARISALEAREPLHGRDGRDGAPGEKGLDGAAGRDGKDGATGPQGEPGQPGQTGPEGTGRDGRDGLPGVPGATGLAGEKGLDGKDGTDGLNGKDGADGLGFEDLEVTYDGAREFAFVFRRGDRLKSYPFRVPIVLDCGVYQAGRMYEKGDGVTFGGSFWIAQDATNAKPGDGVTPWRLSVKVGREGKQGLQGERGLNGKDGRDGKDGQWR
jgi:hypothetical protein